MKEYRCHIGRSWLNFNSSRNFRNSSYNISKRCLCNLVSKINIIIIKLILAHHNYMLSNNLWCRNSNKLKKLACQDNLMNSKDIIKSLIKWMKNKIRPICTICSINMSKLIPRKNFWNKWNKMMVLCSNILHWVEVSVISLEIDKIVIRRDID